jgi:hypothetical protein
MSLSGSGPDIPALNVHFRADPSQLRQRRVHAAVVSLLLWRGLRGQIRGGVTFAVAIHQPLKLLTPHPVRP